LVERACRTAKVDFIACDIRLGIGVPGEGDIGGLSDEGGGAEEQQRHGLAKPVEEVLIRSRCAHGLALRTAHAKRLCLLQIT
jgi:hypothetical protein